MKATYQHNFVQKASEFHTRTNLTPDLITTATRFEVIIVVALFFGVTGYPQDSNYPLVA